MSDENIDSTRQQSEFVEPSANELEKLEEAKLKAKFPGVGGRPIGGHSAFLQKRLAKGKFFDSGDYQMAKQKSAAKPKPTAGVLPTGDAIPTPETVPQRKTSIIQQKSNTSVIQQKFNTSASTS